MLNLEKILSKHGKTAIRAKQFQGTIINTDPMRRNEKSAKIKSSPSQKKTEFHRLAVVAFPLEKKCVKSATELNGGSRCYKANLGDDFYILSKACLPGVHALLKFLGNLFWQLEYY